MSNQELQELLIEKIRKTDDNMLLEEATRLLDVDIDDFDVHILSESEKADIEEARQQIKNGESFTHEEANQHINEWLKK
ncbi:MAG: hypothetical protein ABIN67_13915 [Ferruginibacter sp.]